MADPPNKFSRFLMELKRRKTNRVLVMYAAAAFVVLQLADILIGGLSLPGWVMTLIIIIVATGFPVAVIFSWVFDITPGGIEKTKPLNLKRRNKLEAQLRTWKETTMVSLIVIIALIIFNIVRGNIQSSEIKRTEKSIAVLPFDNLTPNEVLPFTTDVVTSFIRTGLNKTNVLQVRDRWEVQEFRTIDRPIEEIAKKLNVFFLVIGEMVSSKELVIVNINLLRYKKNKVDRIWGNKYSFDPKGKIDDLDEIPVDIVNALKIVLSDDEKKRISKRPTVNTAAFFNYMEGTAYQDDAYNGLLYLSMGDSIFKDLSVAKSFDRAIFFYDKAIIADSTFALAYAKRALTRAWGYKAGHYTMDQMDKCRSDAERALQIENDLPDAKIAYGFYYYYFKEDYDKALEYFREVAAKDPENSNNNYYMALVLRAQGKWEKSQALIKEVVKYNLQNPLFLTNIGLSYHYLHQYDSAIYYQDRAIKILPGWSGPYNNKIESLVFRDGNTAEAEIVLDTAAKRTTGGYLLWIRIIFDLYNGRYKEALLKAELGSPSDFSENGTRSLLLAEIYRNLNNPSMAYEHYKAALEYFNECLVNNPDDPLFLSSFGIAAAGLKERAKALDAGQKAITLTKYNGAEKSDRMIELAQIYTMLGDYDKSLKILDELLKNPSNISIKLLQLDPVWKPLHDKPEFKKLLLDYSNKKYLN
jgi:tetratricopeptide (TPR) repeat protein/TolB-like protein